MVCDDETVGLLYSESPFSIVSHSLVFGKSDTIFTISKI